MRRAVAITLKIPDNTAYTAAVALRNLGLPVEHVERSEIWSFDDEGDGAALLVRIESDATMFNPNKHRAMLLREDRPRDGELWVVLRQAQDDNRYSNGPAAIAWRLFTASRRRADRSLLAAAAEGLLCNPAIERAVYPAGDDNGNGGEY